MHPLFSASAELAKDNEPRFVRQRRNLIITSLIVIVYRFGELQVTDVNFLGNRADIGNPEIVFYGLVTIFVWFFIRYCQAYNDVNAFSAFSEPFRKSIEDGVYHLAIRRAAKVSGKLNKDFSLDFVSVDGNDEDGWDRSRNNTRWRVERNINGIRKPREDDPILEINRRDRFWLKAQYVYHVCIRRSHFTEYLFPFLLAAAAAIVAFQDQIFSVINLMENIL